MNRPPIMADRGPGLEARPPGARRYGRAEALALLSVCVACAGLYWLALGPGLACMGDDGYYLMLAKSIWLGCPYREFWQVGHPWHRLYPPGYPLLLAPFVGPFPHSPWLWKLPGAMAACAIVPLTYTLARPRMRPAAALGAAAWVGLSPWVILLACGFTLSEVPYMAVSLAALNAIDCADRKLRRSGGIGAASDSASGATTARADTGGRPWTAAPAAAAWTGLAVALRTTGLALAVAGAVWLLGRRRPGAAVGVALAAVAVVVPWQVYVSRHAADGGLAYSVGMRPQSEPGSAPTTLQTLTSRVRPQVRRYLTREIPYLLWLPPTDFVAAVRAAPPSVPLAGEGLLLLALAGLALDARAALRADHLYLPLFLLPLCVWPWVSLRLVGPVLPLFAVYGAVALDRLLLKILHLGTVRWTRPLGLAASAVAAAVLLAPQALRAVEAAAATRSPHWPEPAQARVYALGRWMDRHLEPDAVVASIVPANLALVTHRQMTAYLQTRHARRLIHRLAHDGVTYLFIDGLHARQGFPFLENAIRRYPSRFSPVPAFPPGPEQLLRFHPYRSDLRPDPIADRAIVSPWMTQWRQLSGVSASGLRLPHLQPGRLIRAGAKPAGRSQAPLPRSGSPRRAP